MKKIQRKTISAGVCAVAAFAVCNGVYADISAASTSNGISFPGVGEAASLTVSCDSGIYWQMEFSAEESPSFIAASEGGLWPDGECKYELRTQPKMEEAKDELDEARIALEEEERVRIKIGNFIIVSGSVSIREAPEFIPASDKAAQEVAETEAEEVPPVENPDNAF